MKKIGILTYHYTNNFGGVLQSYSLYKFLENLGVDVEIINFIPSYYKEQSFIHSTGITKFLKHRDKEVLKIIAKRIYIKSIYNKKIKMAFDNFRNDNIRISERVNEKTLLDIIGNYEKIIVGSDQIWSPKQRGKKEYFLDFEDNYKGKKISYSADSSNAIIDTKLVNNLKNELQDFDAISVRNVHTYEFVKQLTEIEPEIVVDPTILYDFNEMVYDCDCKYSNENYILVYVLGEDISGTNKAAINLIKEVYGDLKVYAVIIPTMVFNPCDYADKIFYDIGPIEWLKLVKNARFVFTDSYHGTLFSIKFKRRFLSYYSEEIRKTRFIDISSRYGIGDFIVKSIDEIDTKGSLKRKPDFEMIDRIMSNEKNKSIEFIKNNIAY